MKLKIKHIILICIILTSCHKNKYSQTTVKGQLLNISTWEGFANQQIALVGTSLKKGGIFNSQQKQNEPIYTTTNADGNFNFGNVELYNAVDYTVKFVNDNKSFIDQGFCSEVKIDVAKPLNTVELQVLVGAGQLEFIVENYDTLISKAGKYSIKATLDVHKRKPDCGVIDPPKTSTEKNILGDAYLITNLVQYSLMGNYYLDIYKYYSNGTLKEHKLDTFYVAWKQDYTYKFVW